MKTILLCIGCFCTFGVLAQTIKKTVEHPAVSVREKYYVLKADTGIKQGKYQMFSSFTGALFCEGYYKNNLKDSLWTYLLSGKIIETGYYKDGRKTGVWDGFDYKGKPSVKYDFTANKLLFFKIDSPDTVRYNVINGKDTVKIHLDSPPIYLDGSARLGLEIGTGVHYPIAARQDHVQGKVLVAFTIDQQGMTSNYIVNKGIGDGCDEEALKGVKRIQGDWLPGMLNGKPVTVEYVMPVSFTLQNN